MTSLLDTHVRLWILSDPSRLCSLRRWLEDDANALLFSAASSWEIAIEHAPRRLHLPKPPLAQAFAYDVPLATADAALGAYDARILTP